jgi:hypothetical protein
MTQKKLVLSKTTLKNLSLRTGIKTGYDALTKTCDGGGGGDTLESESCDSQLTELCSTGGCINTRTSSCSGFGLSTGGCSS